MVISHNARIINGSLKLYDKFSFVNLLKSFEGKEIEIEVKEKKSDRSQEQNAYYWGVVVPIVQAGLIDAGFEREIFRRKEAVHELLKGLFCPLVQIVELNIDSITTLEPTTTNLNTKQMLEYFDDIKRWASEFLGVFIPDPVA